ncbi:hypothetical protein [Glycomyces paridis]|uniref:Uncharacterized protein n=1 Tax=Glycomyces paridis TaxID=2126555 RepID=A0A4S8PRT8_9ACTN|nr:hypothetical protein [Glycomyces paridis]THV30904.1 hypothetical protein E9998_05920 [Glycomyces paridis]
MARKSPGAIRAELRTLPYPDDPPSQDIARLSARTVAAIHRVEYHSRHYHLFPGVTASALRRYRAFLATGRGLLYPKSADCSCPGCSIDDVRHARDVLETVLEELRGRPRSELRREVAALDRRYRDRTLPDFRAPLREHELSGWWHHRLT